MVVPFPYTERAARKVRPAVVVSGSALADVTGLYYVAMITNAAHQPWTGDVPVSDLGDAGLPVPSVVRPARIATIDEGAIIRAIGVLPKSERKRVHSAINRFLAKCPEAT